MKPFCAGILVLVSLARISEAGTWVPVSNHAPGAINLMLLLPDGTVMAANSGGNAWYRLTPDIHGSYASGTWSTLAAMHDTRLYYSSQVLTDGRVFVAGGEYGTGTAAAEVYNPLTNIWTQVNPPVSLLDPNGPSAISPGTTQRFYDSNSEILPNGNVLIAPVLGKVAGQPLIYNPTSNTWAAGPLYVRGVYMDESSWVKLPDNSILTLDPFGSWTNGGINPSERYIPSMNSWVNDGVCPNTLYDQFGFELGASFLLPNGKAFVLGSTGQTAIYTPSGDTSPGFWTAGPDIPDGQGTPDAPAAMMANGKILCAVSPTPTNANHFPPPTSFYEYDYTTNSFNHISGPTGITEPISSYVAAMLVLPDGNVLWSEMSDQLYVYQPGGTPVASGKPTILSISPNPDGSYHLTGNGLNGISEGAAYGDDLQMASNYPLVRLSSGSNVYYARTYNWSSTGVMTGSAVVSTEFKLPAGLPTQQYSLAVVANGIASDPVAFPGIYVKAGSTGANNGSSWTDAYQSLQDALSSPATGSTQGEIWVAAGTYMPDGGRTPVGSGHINGSGDQTKTFQLKSNLRIIGGFRGLPGDEGGNNNTTRPLDPQTGLPLLATVLSGDLAGNDGSNFSNYAENSYHVVTSNATDGTAVLDGVSIAGGNSDGSAPNNDGAGILNTNGAPTITRCTIRDNRATRGAGMHSNGGNPAVTDCVFESNKATPGGGGGFFLEAGSSALLRCQFITNDADSSAGGMFADVSTTPTLTDCLFAGNRCALAFTTLFGGGGLGLNQNSVSVLTGCRFIENKSIIDGAGGLGAQLSASVTMARCSFTGNKSGASGGAIHLRNGATADIVNALFNGNAAGNDGAGVYLTGGASAVLRNCTLSANAAGGIGGAVGVVTTPSQASLANSIAYGNSASSGTNLGSSGGGALTVSYSDIGGGSAGTGNIDADPRFLIRPGGIWTSAPTYSAATGRTTLTNSAASFTVGALVGRIVNPNTGQGLQTIITDNTATTVTVWGDFSGMGITNGTPYQFHEYHLQGNSPCIDAASNAAIPGVTTDLDGNPRIYNSVVDMGPFEFQPMTACFSAGPNPGTCPQPVTFDAGCSIGYGINNYNWDFGCAGCTASGPGLKTTQFTYQTAGTYTAILTLTNDDLQTSVFTNVITINPNASPPTSLTVTPNNFCVGSQSQVQLGASGGSGTSIQWFEGSCGGTLVGTGGTITVPAPTSPKTYYARWMGSCGSSACTQVIINVYTPGVVTQQPHDAAACVGQSASFTTAVTSNPAPLSYQWRKNFVPLTGDAHISGQDTPTLTINPVNGSDTGTYDCRVATVCNIVATNAVSLSIASSAPTFTVQPQGYDTCAGQSLDLYASATGNPAPNYQWRRNGVDIPGANSPSYDVPVAGPQHSGTYVLVATTACFQTLSDPAVMNIFATGTGDGNLDGHRNGRDIPGFLDAIFNWDGVTYTGAYCAYDMNGDAYVDESDISGFVTAILNGN